MHLVRARSGTDYFRINSRVAERGEGMREEERGIDTARAEKWRSERIIWPVLSRADQFICRSDGRMEKNPTFFALLLWTNNDNINALSFSFLFFLDGWWRMKIEEISLDLKRNVSLDTMFQCIHNNIRCTMYTDAHWWKRIFLSLPWYLSRTLIQNDDLYLNALAFHIRSILIVSM